MTLEQIDLYEGIVRATRAISRWPIPPPISVALHKAGKVASLIGVEGGHQIDNSLRDAARCTTISACAT